MTGPPDGEVVPPTRDLASLPPPRREVPAGAPRSVLGRLFWIGAAAILVLAAFVAIAAIVRGDFSDTDWKILGTLGSLLLCGALTVAGLSLVERRSLKAFGWAAVAIAGVGLGLLLAAIWQGFESETLSRWAGTALVLVTASLLVATSLLLLRGRALLMLVAAEAVAFAIAALIAIGGIWSDDLSEGSAKADAVFWILGVLGWLLVPILQRFTSAGVERGTVRVLAELDGVELVASRDPVDGVRVANPVAGERLTLRRRP